MPDEPRQEPATSGGAAATGRLATVDAWRFIAILAVVAIHTAPARVSDPSIGTNWFDASFLLTQMARFAVPYFFVVSGYFWGLRAGRAAEPMRASWPAIRRIAGLFVVWSVLFALPHDVRSIGDGGPLQPIRVAWWHLHHELAEPLTLLMQGTKSPLWFLVALICAMTISACFVQLKLDRALVVVAVLLYAIQLLARPYLHTVIGLPLAFNTRNGPFVGTLFFVTGLALSRRTPRASWAAWGLVLFMIGTASHLVENRFVAMHLGITTSQDFVVGTYPMGLGIALIALSGRRSWGTKGLARLGHYALGCYVVHALFVELFEPLGVLSPPIVAHLLSIALVTTCSLALVWLLSKGRRSRMLVS